MTQNSTTTKIKINQQVKEPPLFRVIYLNDDQTSMDFVVESLVHWFDYTIESAQHITVEIHEQGSAVVAILPFELAEQKGIEITMSARAQSFPLQIKLEPETV